MTKFYVATLARYVLVEADTEDQAREAGRRALFDLYANLSERFNHDVPINIRTVRPATAEDIELWKWHHEMVGKENRTENQQA
jgi:hypothetical protein